MIALRKNRKLQCRVYEPTRTDIRRACEEIRAAWSPRERAQRNRGPRPTSWTPPMIRLTDLVEAIDGEQADNPSYAGAAGYEAEC